MQTCRGICNKYKASKPHGYGRYEVGQKRCICCAIYLYWDGIHCPCCRANLRTKPRKLRDRKRLATVMEKKTGIQLIQLNYKRFY